MGTATRPRRARSGWRSTRCASTCARSTPSCTCTRSRRRCWRRCGAGSCAEARNALQRTSGLLLELLVRVGPARVAELLLQIGLFVAEVRVRAPAAPAEVLLV